MGCDARGWVGEKPRVDMKWEVQVRGRRRLLAMVGWGGFSLSVPFEKNTENLILKKLNKEGRTRSEIAEDEMESGGGEVFGRLSKRF